MKTKKILIVSRSFYPVNTPRAFRTTELVKEFARQGHAVTLLTVKDDEVHIPFEKKYGVTIRDLGPLRFPEINLNGEKGIARLFKRVLRRGLIQLLEYPDVELVFRVNKALEQESGYDLMISVATPHPVHWGVARAWRDDNSIAKTWVADCGDPYMGAPLDTFDKMFYFKYVEKDFCRKADYITVPLEEAREGYYPEFHDKIKVVPQGFNFDVVPDGRSQYRPNTVPTFAYAGGLIPGGRDPREFLDYLVSIKRPYRFILYTKSRNLVTPYLSKAGGQIEIRDYIPREKLLNVLSGMDFLVNFENKTTLQLPSKLIDYYLTGRPVLSVGNHDIDTDAVDQFLEGDYRGQYQFGDMDRYRIENVCRQFLALCT
ncbi:MAG: glycosyltransferase [Balneolaceae bacterium]|nr:glycosyltransferase [Balneolaceae bacterium]